MDRVLAICGLIAAVGAALEVLRRVVRGVIATARKLARLADDLLGEPARGSQPARPGLMERFERVEAIVLKELRPNGGGSLKDQVARVEQTVGADQG